MRLLIYQLTIGEMRKFFVAICIFTSFCIASSNSSKKAAIVIDYSNNKTVLLAENADAIRHPASLTKLMTAYLIFDAIRSGKLNLNTKFKVSKLAAEQMPSKLGVKIGEKIALLDIIKGLLVKSANDIAVVAAEGISGSVKNFAIKMNQKAKQLGMRHTHFENPSGVPNKKQVTTARDIATLGMALFKNFPQYWHFFSGKSFKYKGQTFSTSCKILKWYKGSDGAKTGYICASGFNLFVTAQKYNKSGKAKRLFVVVMGGDSAKARDLEAARLMNKYFGSYNIASIKAKSPNKNTPPKKSDKALSKQIEKDIIIEEALQEEEEMTFSEILEYSVDEQKMIDQLYEIGDESMEVLDEEVINVSDNKHKKKTKSQR